MKGSILVLVSLCHVVTGCADRSCRPGWEKFGRSCYDFSTDEQTWDNAQDKCKAVGAYLVEVESQEENNFLQKLARNKTKDYWLGGGDAETEGKWKWANSEHPFKFEDWSPGNPNNAPAGQDCLHLWPNGQFHWDDDYCSREHNYICEIRSFSAMPCQLRCRSRCQCD